MRSEFDRIAPNKARCRKCPYEVAPLVDRMKKHISKVHMTTPKPVIEQPISKQPRISHYARSTTTEQKKRFDHDIGRFFFSNNIPYRAVESSHFKKLVNDFHPGYQPQSKKVRGSEILDDVYMGQQEVAKKNLSGKLVTYNFSFICCFHEQLLEI